MTFLGTCPRADDETLPRHGIFREGLELEPREPQLNPLLVKSTLCEPFTSSAAALAQY